MKDCEGFTDRKRPVRASMAGLAITVVAAVALTGCGSESADGPDGAASAVAPPGVALAPAQSAAYDVLAHPARPGGDRDDDALRKPAEVLAFAGVKPGMDIFELEAGGGYYTELLSRLVGPAGTIILHNPASFDSFVDAPLSERLKGGRLANVRRVKSDFDELEAPDDSIDMATWFLGPHELYFAPPGVEDFGDVEGAYAEVYRILKPGGLFVILDHAAPAGSPTTTGGDLHRIDPAIVKGLAEASGFDFVAESDILFNPDDRYDLGVFDPIVRRKTDRFLLKYRKPLN